MSRQQLKWIVAFVVLVILAGYVGSRVLNSGKGVEMAFEVLRKNHHETGLLTPKVIKLRSVSEIGAIEARYYTISFQDKRGVNRRAEVKCTRNKDEYKCIELL